MKRANPKAVRAQKEGKVQLELLPTVALREEAQVLQHGAEKYGMRNWRIDHISALTYVGAIMRHLLAWADGEDIDPDSGLSHLSHIRASCGLVLDAQERDCLIDDRQYAESFSEE